MKFLLIKVMTKLLNYMTTFLDYMNIEMTRKLINSNQNVFIKLQVKMIHYNYIFFGKALGEGLGLLKTGSLLLSLFLSPLYPFHPSIPFIPLSLSPLSLSLCLSLSLLSLPPSLYLSFYLSFSLSLLLSLFSLSPSISHLSIILFGVSNGRFRPCLSTSNG